MGKLANGQAESASVVTLDYTELQDDSFDISGQIEEVWLPATSKGKYEKLANLRKERLHRSLCFD